MSDKPTPKAKGGFDLIAQEMVDAAYETASRTWDMARGDSPIERIFYTGLVTLAGQGHRCIEAICPLSPSMTLEYAKDFTQAAGEIWKTAFIEPQKKLAGWRVDFVIHFPDWLKGMDAPYRRLLIECDGHDYHERTKEQAARDRARDRLAQYEGLPIFRFTGSEIWRDPWGCADEVLAFMERQ